jgi:hypothetical protein
MKGLPCLKLVTHTGSWFGVMLEGDTEVIHSLYLKLQITLHILRTNVSYELLLTMFYTLICFE